MRALKQDSSLPLQRGGNLLLISIGLIFAMATSAPAETWPENQYSRIQLLSASSAVGDGKAVLLGIVIETRPHWKTYWRAAGEAGLPPHFEWRTGNASAPQLLWPAPERFAVAGVESYGYTERVVFPVWVQPRDPSLPLLIEVSVDFAVCLDICVPQQAALSLTLAPGPSAPTVSAGQIAAALARIPAPQDATSQPRIEAAHLEMRPGASSLHVLARSQRPFAQPELFVDGADDFLFSAPAVSFNAGRREAEFILQIHTLDPEQTLQGARLTLTLVDGNRAVEHRVILGP